MIPAGFQLDRLRLVPPVFVPQRMAQLVELGREPVYRDVRLETTIGGFRSALPTYVSRPTRSVRCSAESART
ncbi:hypothetical protein ACIBL3_22945 [Kribbella sp. NPDC050124]|uniref:hypothetical protein n=1 Tax=Kribbella sp. NPDC050124 TaxID=3364114 RepID=UPI00378CBE90